MPIIEIEFVFEGDDLPQSRLESSKIQLLTDRLGEIISQTPRSTWVKLIPLSSKLYAENKSDGSLESYPLTVRVLQRTLGDRETRKVLARSIARCVSEQFPWPLENVHVLFLPEADGRIWFGSQLSGDP